MNLLVSTEVASSKITMKVGTKSLPLQATAHQYPDPRDHISIGKSSNLEQFHSVIRFTFPIREYWHTLPAWKMVTPLTPARNKGQMRGSWKRDLHKCFTSLISTATNPAI
uniref:Anthranilate phosphoribosyltransferase n=1 Tax=Lygus hesperus TaxID=30085 RepID=A0A0A9YPV9_LYGHE